MKIAAVAAMSLNRVIGCGGKLPWHIPEDIEHFKSLTKGGVVLMGRKTFESFPDRFRPLPNRRNIVVTRFPEALNGYDVEVWNSPFEKLGDLDCNLLWVIGGGEIYSAYLPRLDQIYLTLVNRTVDGDAFFPEFERDFKLVSREDRGEFSLLEYERIPARGV